MKKVAKILVGSLERCDLPAFLIENLEMRVDTGAKTSSLHVDNIVEDERDGELWISFDIHPDIHNVDTIVNKTAKVKDVRKIKSSSGDSEQRYVIDTNIILGGQEWTIELTLTDRSSMTYLMLLGREAMKNRILVDPSKKYLAS